MNVAGVYPSDEEILGMEPTPQSGVTPPGTGQVPAAPPGDRAGIPGPEPALNARQDDAAAERGRRDSGADGQAEGVAAHDAARKVSAGAPTAPDWLAPLLADPQAGPQLRSLWEEHTAYREALSSVADARALKQMLPGGADDARAFLARAAEADQLDAAYFSGETAAQAQLAERLLGDDPRAFRTMLRQAARALAAREPLAFAELARSVLAEHSAAPAEQLPAPRTQAPAAEPDALQRTPGALPAELVRQREELERARGELERDRQQFRAAQFASFQQTANDALVARVRQSIEQTLAGALPDTVPEGARQRIAEDIFEEVHATLASDAALTRQVAGLLRQWRFDDPTRQQVVNLIYARARKLLPGAAKRIVSDWTTSVLSGARARAEKAASAAQRADIAGPGATEPVSRRRLEARDIDYAATSDEQILSW